jgi:predicted metal-binding membrane protein
MWHEDAQAVKAHTLTVAAPIGVRRPVPVALGCIVALTIVAWAVLLAEAWRRESGIAAFLEAVCSPAAIREARSVLEGIARLGVSAGLWIAMSVAMMLPTASAFLISYAEIAEERELAGERVVSPAVPALGYLAVWAGVSVVAALAQALLGAALSTVALPTAATTILAGAALGAAGLYQFSPTKLGCLTRFREPSLLLRERWSNRPSDALRLGVDEGGRCFHACWGLMLVMVAVGAMNLIWMALFSVLIAAEKLSGSARFAKTIGAALLVAGTALSVSAVAPARLLMVLGF